VRRPFSSLSLSIGSGLTYRARLHRNDLRSVLSKSSSSLNVGLLLESIAQTDDFEREMARKYNLPFEEVLKLSQITYGINDSSMLITSVFEPYLGVFVDAQDKCVLFPFLARPVVGLLADALHLARRTLSDMMQSFTSSRISISPSDNPSAVLPSSTELFYFYREALERCAKLSTRQLMLDLCKVYRKWLKTYAENVLTAALIKCVCARTSPLAEPGLTASRPYRFDRKSSEGRPNMQELHTACLVLNTAEYCLETAAQVRPCPQLDRLVPGPLIDALHACSQLEERLQERIHPDFRDRVSLEGEKDLFTGTASAALLAILRELEFTAEPCFASMARSPWREAELVSSESVYVGELTRVLETVVGVVREGVEQKKYVRSVCDKIVGCVPLSLCP